LFRLGEPALRLGVLGFHILPRTMCELLLALVRHVPTLLGVALRYMLVARLAKRCGRCVAVFEGVYLRGLATTEFGDNVSIHPMCYVEGQGGLRIGSDASIAHGASILTVEHDFALPGVATRDAPLRPGRVEIGDDVWLGCGARVLAGVTIGPGAVIGAGAVVTRPAPAGCVAAGVPARVVRVHTKSALPPAPAAA
jgi:acetyltransferase-like isoleucine patch superfamily enzyme